ncbi:MAG: zinc ribbon domain-containing protein [Rhizobiales bacterium]|nr:zinc ribbon domain-containing protein [Hyphomicrobiales bacterium]
MTRTKVFCDKCGRLLEAYKPPEKPSLDGGLPAIFSDVFGKSSSYDGILNSANKCSACGSKLNGTDVFCGDCGQKV